MLAKSSKSRFAAIAIMALGVSTFMGTSAALATPVNVSGTVGECSSPSTVAAAAVDFERVKRDSITTKQLSPVITDGKTAECAPRGSTVTATIGTLTGVASTDESVEANRVALFIGTLSGESFPVTATVPATAAIDGVFGATVTLTLSNNL